MQHLITGIMELSDFLLGLRLWSRSGSIKGLEWTGSKSWSTTSCCCCSTCSASTSSNNFLLPEAQPFKFKLFFCFSPFSLFPFFNGCVFGFGRDDCAGCFRVLFFSTLSLASSGELSNFLGSFLFCFAFFGVCWLSDTSVSDSLWQLDTHHSPGILLFLFWIIGLSPVELSSDTAGSFSRWCFFFSLASKVFLLSVGEK